jgi:opacity protein-like surface antigen
MFPAPGTRPAGSVHGRRPADGEASFDDQPGREIEDARAKQKDWEFALAPYLWLLSVSADVKAGPISAGKDVCVTDLLRNLDMIAQLRFEGLHKQRWGFFLDGTYIGLSTEARAKVGPFKLRGLDVDAELRLAWLDFGAMYRFGRSGRSFDAFLGGRVAHVSTALSLGPFVNSAGDSDFVSPVIGGRFERAFSERWIGSLKGEVGGFGVQGADLYWGATAALGYRLTKHATLEVGYRVYDWNYRQGRRELDLTFHGPIIGLVFRF